MATTCAVCKRSHTEEVCPYCTVTDVKVSELTDKLHLQHGGDGNEVPTAFLVDLVSNRKIPITTPRCKVGRDDLNDIVISGDQSISRFHFVITKDSDQYMVQDSKSRHGTFLNGNQIAGPIPINDGDVLKVGVSLFWFVIENQTVGASDQFSPVDIESIDAQEMKVSANEKTTPYAPTRETDISSMTSLKEVLAQAKAKESAGNEEEMSKTIAPGDVSKAKEAAEKSEKAEAKEDKAAEKADEKSEDKADSKDSKEEKTDSDAKDSKGKKDVKEDKDAKGNKSDKDEKSEQEEKNSDKSEESSEKKDSGMQITASMLMEALEHESLSEVSRLDDKKAEDENGKGKTEEAESKDKGKKNKKNEEDTSEKDSKGLFSDNGSLDKTSEEKESNSSNNKDQEGESSDKIAASEADKTPETKSEEEDFSPGKPESDSENVSKSTLDKMADAVQEMSSSESEKESQTKEENSAEEKAEDKASSEESNKSDSIAANKEFEQEIVEKTKNGAWSGNTMQDTKVPDWCSKYFASELNLLVKDLDNLNEQVRNAQNKIKEVENRLAATKSLRNTLLTATGEDLVEACGKVLARLGWRVKIVEDDKQELRLESDEKVSICRIIWTQGLPERTHLGQLSIAQTRYWCEQGAEPKGILIAAQAEDKPPPKITDTDYSGELAEYASKKNVLMFTTLQLLAMYKEIALNEGSAEALRSSILSSSGWLKGYSLDPSDEDEKEPSKLASASA
ncbi:MAG TPA: FHA domain-containing protein [Candidatus Melainabacteria bacterium]|nr:FHA domain-containing protein [Candidatus Melainabacteria bacterium]